MKSVLMFVLLLSIVGCARGFDRGALRGKLNHESPAQIMPPIYKEHWI